MGRVEIFTVYNIFVRYTNRLDIFILQKSFKYLDHFKLWSTCLFEPNWRLFEAPWSYYLIAQTRFPKWGANRCSGTQWQDKGSSTIKLHQKLKKIWVHFTFERNKINGSQMFRHSMIIWGVIHYAAVVFLFSWNVHSLVNGPLLLNRSVCLPLFATL